MITSVHLRVKVTVIPEMQGAPEVLEQERYSKILPTLLLESISRASLLLELFLDIPMELSIQIHQSRELTGLSG